ncbi:axin interactor, dorsalization-associated protein isoform X4 [Mustelus asterias]
MTDINKTIQKWHASFKKGTDFDSWGQLVEAIDEYQILARHLQKEVQSTANSSEFSEDQKRTLGKIATCLELRSSALQTTQTQEEFKLEDLKTLEPSTLLPRLPSEPGMALLTIKIEKIGLKDAGQCIDPYVTVSVKDANGVDLTPVQDTPIATRKEDMYIHFAVDVEIQKHIEKLPKGAAIFFEFKHYKPKKRFTSTKCFAFMEMDEIKAGQIVIELYKKPTDFKRKKLHLLTKKPLYLHLHQTLHKE